jgi:hypothetical protein
MQGQGPYPAIQEVPHPELTPQIKNCFLEILTAITLLQVEVYKLLGVDSDRYTFFI